MEYTFSLPKNVGNLLVILSALLKHEPKVVLSGEQRSCIWTIYYTSMKYKYRKIPGGSDAPKFRIQKGRSSRHVHSGLLPSSNISFKSQPVSLQ